MNSLHFPTSVFRFKKNWATSFCLTLRSLYILAALLLVVSCKKDEKVYIPMSGDYLPMQVNNYWDIDHYDRLTITGTKSIDNKTYFVFVRDTDTSYYRNENDKIYIRRTSGEEELIYNLTAKVNETWTNTGPGFEQNITLVSKTDTVIINNTKIPGCYQFFFNIPQIADDEHSIWLAPGIGFIKTNCGFCPYPFLNLNKAEINGNVITFP